MKKFICPVCGYVYEGETAPEKCPQCGVPGSKFKVEEGETVWASEHVVGVAKDVSPEILEGLRANFQGECTEVGMYLAMARVAHREGYPEIGLYWEKAAYEEAEHAAKFAELLKHDFFKTERNPEQKLVVFSESVDTVEYLARRINRKDVLVISAIFSSKCVISHISWRHHS